MPKTIMIDLDGVLNNYCGIYKENEIDSVREGAKEFLDILSKNYEIEIFTVRDKNLAQKWLDDNDLSTYVKNITDVKNPYASMYIDDRGINFSGNYNETLKLIENFKPHWK